MRLIRVLTFLFLLAGIANAQSTTAITGTFRDLTGSLITSGQVAFTLQPGIDTQVSGTARFTPTEVDCLINGSGLLKALDGTSTCTLVQNTSITTPANTSWKACVQPGFIQPGSCFVFYAVGSTLDITTVPATPSLTPAYSLVDTFSNQTIGGNKTFSGIVGFTGTLNVGALTLGGPLSALNGGALGGAFTGNPSFAGTVSATSMLCKNFEGVRCAAQFAGTDWCEKVTAADSDLGSTQGEIWMDQSAGTSACAAAPTLSSNHALRFIQGGTYAIGVGWTITNQANWGISGPPGSQTTISFTGSAGFSAVGSGLPNGSLGNRITDIQFQGNSGIATVASFTNISHSYFDFSARDCTGTAIKFAGSVINTGRLRVSSNEGTFLVRPTQGVSFDKTTSPLNIRGGQVSFWMITEGVSGNGIEVIDGFDYVFTGTSEGNGTRGIQIDATAGDVNLLNFHGEVNATEDILDNGTSLFITGGTYNSTNILHVGSTGVGVYITGNNNIRPNGTGITVDSGGAGVFFYGNTTGDFSTNATLSKAVFEASTAILTNKSLGGTGSTTPNTPFNRFAANRGTALVSGDFSISGWGTTASIGSIRGTDTSFSFIVSSAGTGQTATPTATLTFHDGTWTNSPVCVASPGPGNTGADFDIRIATVSATQILLAAVSSGGTFTPGAGATYGFSVNCFGR